MTYTKEEKQKIDTLLAAFGDYIEDHKYFDIAYSNKSGYIFLALNAAGAILDETMIQEPDDLLTLLFNETADDVRDERISNGDDSVYLYQTEVTALHHALEPILSSLEKEDKAYCLYALDQYINQYNQINPGLAPSSYIEQKSCI